jgi:hypothetical protein
LCVGSGYGFILPEGAVWMLKYESLLASSGYAYAGGKNQDLFHPLLSVGPVYDDGLHKKYFLVQIPLFPFKTNCPLPF